MSDLVFRDMPTTVTRTASPGVYNVTLSTSNRDRDDDNILASGWKIPARVPLQWGHDSKTPAIGRVVNAHVEGDRLRGRLEFPPAGVYPFADQIRSLVDAGFLPNVSVGFRPLQREPNGAGGYTYSSQELVELSVVNCPSQVDATIDGKMSKWIGASLDGIEIADDDEIVELDDDLVAAIRSFGGSKARQRHVAGSGERIDVNPDDIVAALASAVPEMVLATRAGVAREVRAAVAAEVRRAQGKLG